MIGENFLPFLKIVIFVFHTILIGVKANNVLGCGGYVKSAVDIDYSQVHIKLLTQQGNLKYETECAPNDGYYFIRLYDKGDYILQVSPPAGWSFDPEEVKLKVNGETDPCSLSQDINFQFKGFAVIGTVVAVGSNSGPSGVTVSLKQKDKVVLETVTTDHGNYIFTPLASGVYDVVASHPTWMFINNKVTVTVKDKNGDAGKALVLGGYSMSGLAGITGELSKDLRIILHSEKIPPHKIGCNKEKIATYQPKLKHPVLCSTTPASDGKYSFSGIPMGKYFIVLHFVTSVAKFNVEPLFLELELSHGDVQLTETFKVSGRSLSGQVLKSVSSAGLAGARVSLDENSKNEAMHAITDEQGKFIFQNVQLGSHTVRIEADGVEFNEHRTQLTLVSGPVSALTPARYKVCFVVSVDASSSDLNIPWLIKIGGASSKHEIQTSHGGSACIFLQPARYTASILLTALDEEAGIRFGPKEHVFTVESEPIHDISFSQFLGEIHGSIKCLETCRSLTVTIRPSKGNSGSPRTTISNQGKFVFAEVVPGEYLLSVDKEEWCWRDQTVLVVVNAKTVAAKFEQTGFRLTLNASHRTSLSYVTNKGHTGSLDVVEGTSRQCVSAAGKYVFTPTSCHRFGPHPLAWDTALPQLLSLTATHHQVTGTLQSGEPGPFSLAVKSAKAENIVGPLPLTEEKDVYYFEMWFEPDETVTLVPSSSSNLFQYNPPSYVFTVENDCLFDVVKFKAERALFLKGYVRPPIKGVSIKVVGDNDELTFTTNSDGFFVAGPLDKTQNYLVSAQKNGYIISPPTQKVEMESQKKSEVIKMSFEAFKLSEIIVQIKDENGRPLEGALVSTSGGGNYRQNSLSDEHGSFTFDSLMPGDYFLRPMMKEYTFEPASKMVHLEGGESVAVNVSGVRVAYSIFGRTISLSGEAESEVMLEAIGIGSECGGMQEEAVSDTKGAFRIRGLTPNCQYRLQLKSGANVNEHIERCIPKEREVTMSKEDFRDVDIVVLRPFLQMDVAVFVNTDQQFLSSLSAEIYKENANSAEHVINIGSHPFFMLPPMIMNKQSYSVQLVCSLPHSQYTFTLPSASFTANESFIKLTMDFKPRLRSVEAEISRGTLCGLIFFVVMVTVTLNYNKLEPLFFKVIEMYQSYLNFKRKAPSNRQSKNTFVSPIPMDTFSESSATRKRTVKVRKT